MTAARALLVGMMGTGKTTVGRVLAGRLGWPYVDNDVRLRELTGLGPDELLAQRGEPALRAGEAAVLEATLAAPPPLVAGVAGGAVLDPAQRARLRGAPDALVVWLRARPETLAVRVGSGAGRPWLRPDALTALRALAAARDPLYAEVAELVVDVDDRTPDAIADQIAALLG